MHRSFVANGHIYSKIVHTGQHGGNLMSDIFFNELDLPKPDYFLNIPQSNHAIQIANIMLALEPVLDSEKPDYVLVVGDVNTTLAAALTAIKMQIPVIHVEAGLRSGDRRMPEEINRILTDSMSDWLFVTEQSGKDNLLKEGTPPHKIHFVGNCLIDTLIQHQNAINNNNILHQIGHKSKEFIVVTIHRPSNVDTKEGLLLLISLLDQTAKKTPIVFPIHPRTKTNLTKFGLMDQIHAIQNITILEPIGYIPFMQLVQHSKAVLTDSGGIQEETSYLKIPCITFRENTERPITVELGSNVIVNTLDLDHTATLLNKALSNQWKPSNIPPLWDGKASDRITSILLQHYNQ